MPTDPRFNLPQHPIFEPALRAILSITRSNPMVITTSFNGSTPGNNQYRTGLIVRLFIPLGCGMFQANGILGPITVIDESSFSIDIDSTYFDAYVIPPEPPALGAFGTVGQVNPIGEVGNTVAQATRNVLPFT
jgi:hypothetical protein